MSTTVDRGFVRLAVWTTIATYLLILVGALVRAAGAGLGCPDWPHCFGQWIPPTRADQLPPQFDHSQFNAALTWTEYVNRLLGVSIGLLIAATTFLALRRFRHQPGVRWSTVAAFVLVAFEGWLGGQVVRSGLTPWMISAHLLVALLIVTLLLLATFRAVHPHPAPIRTAAEKRVRNLSLGIIALVLGQVGLGTQIRAGIEHAIAGMPDLPRELWLEQVVDLDHLHRAFAALVLLSIIALSSWCHGACPDHHRLNTWSRVSSGLAVAQAAIGAVLAGWHLPPAAQVLHVSVASLLIGALTLQALHANQGRG